jgi:hypothetical protein
MVTGAEVLLIAFGGLFVLWAIVIYGSTFFGPK